MTRETGVYRAITLVTQRFKPADKLFWGEARKKIGWKSFENEEALLARRCCLKEILTRGKTRPEKGRKNNLVRSNEGGTTLREEKKEGGSLRTFTN